MILRLLGIGAVSFCVTFSLFGESNYYVCIDGGGSKTLLQVIDENGRIVSLVKDGCTTDRVRGNGSNINIVGADGVCQVFSDLISDIFVLEEDRQIALWDRLPDCYFVAGMSGAHLPQNREAIHSLLTDLAVCRARTTVMSDAEMALALVGNQGIVLIAGTGSICLGKCGDSILRVGGLGRILGDEGSCHQIGLLGLKAALADEYGWGDATSLTPALRALFQVSELKTLIPQVNQCQISPARIASIAPIVFDCYAEGDEVAIRIIDRAAEDLSQLLAAMLKRGPFVEGEVHLWGGLFQGAQAESFVRKIQGHLSGQNENLKLINRSSENPAVLFAHQKLIAARQMTND